MNLVATGVNRTQSLGSVLLILLMTITQYAQSLPLR
jgi:hypothetical protein